MTILGGKTPSGVLGVIQCKNVVMTLLAWAAG
jgi:hypothetical protein